jgi:hypothetical protein
LLVVVGNDVPVFIKDADKGDMHVPVCLEQFFAFQVGGFKDEVKVCEGPEKFVSGFQEYAETLGQGNGSPLDGFKVVYSEISYIEQRTGANGDQKQQPDEHHDF